MSHSTTDYGLTVGELLGAIRRRSLLIIVVAVLGAVLGGVAAGKAPEMYMAESQLVIQPITTDPFAVNSRPTDVVSPATERSILMSSSIAAEVIERLKLSTTSSDLLGRVSVENPAGSLTLRVSASAASPQRAKELADTFAKVYLEQRAADAKLSIEEVIGGLNGEIESTSKQLAETTSTSSKLPLGSFELQQAEAQISSLRTRLGVLEGRRSELISLSTSPGRITREADLPTSPKGVPKVVLALGVVMVFVTAGVILAVLLDRRGGLVRDRSALEAMLPGVEVVVIESTKDLSPSIGALSLDIELWPAQLPVLLVSSVDQRPPGEVLSQLVQALADARRRTLVLWTGGLDDLERRIDVGGGVHSPTMLESICDGHAGPDMDLNAITVYVTPATGNGSASLARNDAARLVRDWARESHFDVVIAASPSVQFQPGLANFASRVDDIVLCSAGLPPRNDLDAAAALFSKVGVAVGYLFVTDYDEPSRDLRPPRDEPASALDEPSIVAAERAPTDTPAQLTR